MPLEEAVNVLKNGPFRKTNLGFADLDHHRELRSGVQEVVYGEHKTVDQIIAIVDAVYDNRKPLLITRLNSEKINALKNRYSSLRLNVCARTVILNPLEPPCADNEKHVAILSAGTADLPICEEVYETLCLREIPSKKYYDIGVAGLHRLLTRVPEIQKASVLVVVAGMEAALPSVVGGLFSDKPLIAVPTSIGYGANFSGLTPFLGMLNSCAAGIMVVNIDNGFGAGFAAANILKPQLENK